MNIGLIGCGGIANGHMRVYQKTENARVVAVSDISLEKARIFAEKYRINRQFSDYADLLEVKDLDFVDICTPVSTHALIACDAAKSGHNVLLEKPMARSINECDEIILESKRSGVKLCVCHNQIFFPSVRQAKSLVDSGSYDLVSFRTSVKENPEQIQAPSWNMTPEEKGILWEVGCHPVYLQLHFLKNITEIYALGSKVKYPVHDDFVVLLRTPDRRYGIIEISWLARKPEIVYEIDSSDGKRAQIDRIKDSFIENTEESTGLFSDIKRVLRHFTPPRKTLKTELQYLIGHYYLINEYMKSLENDMPVPVQPEEGKRTIKLLECIEESLNKHEVISTK
jgi:predicted dehydrogenase